MAGLRRADLDERLYWLDRTGQRAEFDGIVNAAMPLDLAADESALWLYNRQCGVFAEQYEEAYQADPSRQAADAEINRDTGFDYLATVAWVAQNLDGTVRKRDAPNAYAWSMLERARKDPSILDAPLMMIAKKRAGSDDERAIAADCTKTEKELTALIDRLLEEPL